MIKILIAGDFCPARLEEKEEFCHKQSMTETAAMIAALTAKHDISVVNVETVYSDCDIPIPKSGPNLKSPVWTLDYLKQMDFTVAACANNHIGDFGEKGVLDTLGYLRRMGMRTVGAGANAREAGEVCYIEKGGMNVALINCCEHEYGTARRDRAGSSVMDWDETSKKISEAKGNADAVIVYIHGGNEYNPMPRPGVKKLCRHFAECGASAVIVCHSHCPQGIEIYKGVPIAYGIGNFFFPKEKSEGMWNYGYLVSLQVAKDTDATIEIIPYVQNKESAHIRLLEGQEKEAFMEYMNCISKLMNQEEHYEKLTLAWCAMRADDWAREGLKGATENRNDLGTLIVRNLYTCESHNELLRTYYDAFCDGRIDDSLNSYYDLIENLQKGIAVTF